MHCDEIFFVIFNHCTLILQLLDAAEEKSYCPVCGYAKCQDCLGHPDLEECKVLSALDHQESIKKAPEATTRQLPNSIYEPILPLRLLLTKWYIRCIINCKIHYRCI